MSTFPPSGSRLQSARGRPWLLALLAAALRPAIGRTRSTDPAPARALGLAWELVDVDRPLVLYVNATLDELKMSRRVVDLDLHRVLGRLAVTP